jgi:DNA-binding response OmpR family regulator
MIGVNELLRKPLQRRELAEAVARVLRRSLNSRPAVVN